jgi:hypothetical protein
VSCSSQAKSGVKMGSNKWYEHRARLVETNEAKFAVLWNQHITTDRTI